MAPRPPKPCKKIGCRAVTQEANGFCADHQEHAAAIEKERAKRGDHRRESSHRRGYGQYWQRIRAAHLRANPLCEACHNAKDIVVHHRDENPRNNAGENLATMCSDCHERHHGRRR